ncbi:MAG: redoxin domain-containing protein [Anaerolineales bacterium]|nr:redoxin domain-containing protein [Anaerolineales bacterium]
MAEHIQNPPATSAKKLNVTAIAIWVVVLAVLGLSGYGLMKTNASRPEAGETAPGFTMNFFNGYEWEGQDAVALADLQGKPVVVNFWASWCVECRLEADLLEQAWQQYKDQGVVFVGIAYSDVEPNAKEYLREFNVTYPNAPDLGTSISDDYEITGVPETFFIDRNGVIQHVQIGPVNASMMNSIMAKIMTQ